MRWLRYSTVLALSTVVAVLMTSLVFAQAPDNSPRPNTKPSMPPPLAPILPDTARQLQNLPWEPNEVVYDGSQLCGQQRNPSIAVDGADTVYAIWSDCRNGQWDIYFSFRPAGGSWGANTKVNDIAGGWYEHAPSIAVDHAGNAYAVWVYDPNPLANATDIYFSYRPTGGDWGTSIKVNDNLTNAWLSSPKIVVDGDGNAYTMWQDRRNGNDDIYFAFRPVGGTWDINVKVNDGLGASYETFPSIAVDQAGNAHALWQDGRNGHENIYYAYRPAGGSWGINVKVNDGPRTTGHEYPSVAADGAGNVYAVWTDQRNGNRDIYFSYRAAEGSWGANVKVNDDSGTAWQFRPVIAVDGAGNAHAVWTDGRNGREEVYSAFRPIGGNWGANTEVDDDPGNARQDSPAIAVDSAGNANAVWRDNRNGLGGDIYSASRLTGTNWGANVRVNDDFGSSEQYNPAIGIDGAGNAFAIWEDVRNGDMDVYFSYRPVGGEWGTNVRVNDDVTSTTQFMPDIAVDYAGNAYAVWSDGRNGNGFDVYFSYRPVGGEWSANVKVNDGIGNDPTGKPAIDVDGSGNAYAVWNGSYMGNYDIYFAFRPTGGSWGANVKASDRAVVGSSWPDIAVGNFGNAYVVWVDPANGFDIYSAFRPAGGTWGASVKVNDDFGIVTQHEPAIAVDGYGNAYAVWEDYRNGNPDVYSAFRPIGGSWGANAKVNDNSGDSWQIYPAIAVDEIGNAYAIWADFRRGFGADFFSAHRPPGGNWSSNEQVNDAASNLLTNIVDSAIAVNRTGWMVGAIWMDQRAVESHIYFSHLTSIAVISASPNTGASRGGTSVTITGANFETGADVQFGTTPALNVTVLSDNEISCITPAHAVGPVSITVTNPDGQSATMENGFTYLPFLHLPNTGGEPGVVVQVPIRAGDIENLAAADITVNFDPVVLSARGASVGDLIPGWSLAVNTTVPGEVRLAIAGVGGTTGDAGVLANLEFDVVGTLAMTTTLQFSDVSLNDGLIVVAAVNGLFSVVDGHQVSGTVDFWNNSAGIQGVLLNLDGDLTYGALTGAAGVYTVTGVVAGDYELTPTKSDDVNGISAFDASLALRHSAGLINLTGYGAIAADVNQSGAITSLDASYILQKAANLVALPFPGAAGVWKFDPPVRSYTGLSGSLAGQDFTGVLLGDVSGNWTATPLMQSNAPKPVLSSRRLSASQLVSATLSVPHAGVYPGELTIVPLTLALSGGEVYSADILMSYDPAVATVSSVTAGALIPGWSLALNTGVPGELRVALAGTRAVTGSGEMLRITFQAVGQAAERTPLVWIQGDLNEGTIPSALQNGSISICPDFVDPPGLGVEDLVAAASLWGLFTGDPGWDDRFDLDRDGDIDVVDIMLLTSFWNSCV